VLTERSTALVDFLLSADIDDISRCNSGRLLNAASPLSRALAGYRLHVEAYLQRFGPKWSGQPGILRDPARKAAGVPPDPTRRLRSFACDGNPQMSRLTALADAGDRALDLSVGSLRFSAQVRAASITAQSPALTPRCPRPYQTAPGRTPDRQDTRSRLLIEVPEAAARAELVTCIDLHTPRVGSGA
jgi:hypothetical protein